MAKTLNISNWWKHAFEKAIYSLSNLSRSPQWSKQTPGQGEFVKRVFKLPRGAKILDVGCGTGRHAVLLAKAGHGVTGMDISAQYLIMRGYIAVLMLFFCH